MTKLRTNDSSFPEEEQSLSKTLLDIADRRALEERLKDYDHVVSQLKARLNETQQLTSCGSWEWDQQSGTIWWSDETYRIFGVDPQSYTPSFKNNLSFIHPDDRAEFEAAFEHIIATSNPITVEARLFRPDGELKWFEGKSKAVCDADGRPIRLMGTIQDITKTKLADEALHRAHRKYNHLVANIPVGVFILRITSHQIYTFEFVNTRLADMLKLDAEAILADSHLVFQAIHPDDLVRLYKQNEELVWRYEPFEWTGRAQAGGEGKCFHITSTPEILENGDVLWNGVVTDITEQRLTQQKIVEQKEFVELLINHMPNRIFWKDTNLVYQGCNKEFAKFVGMVDPFNIIGKTDNDIKTGLPMPEAYRACESTVLSTHMPMFNIEEHYLDSRGNDTFISINTIPLKDKNNTLLGILTVCEDVTARNQAEAAVKESEQRYRNLLEIAPVGIAVHVDGKVLFVNSAVKKIFGASDVSELIGKPIEELVHPDSLDAALGRVRRVLDGETDLRPAEEIFIRLDGRQVTVEVMSSPIVYNGKMAVQVVITDITERKLAAKALQSSEARLQVAMDAAKLGYFDWNIKDDLLFMSPQCFTMLGYEPETVDHNLDFWLDKVHSQDKEKVYTRLHALRDGRIPIDEYDVRVLNATGEYRWHHVYSCPVEFDELGNITRLLGFRIDITDRKRMDEELHLRNLILAGQQEATIDGILVADTEGRVVSYNHRFSEMWDIPHEVIDNKDYEPVLQAVMEKLSEPAAFIGKIRRIYANMQEKSREEIILKNGQTVESYSSPMISAEGRYYGRVWYFRDITEQKQIEESLRRTKEDFETIFNLVPVQIWEIDSDRKIVRVNETVCANLKKSRNDIEGHFIKEIFPWYGDKFSPEEQKVFQTGMPSLGRIEKIMSPSGKPSWVQTDMVPVIGKTRTVTSFIALVNDITAIKQADAARLDSEARFRQMAEHIQEVFFLFERQGDKPLYMSPSVQTIFGVTEEMIYGDASVLKTAVHRDDAAHVKFIDPEQFYSTPIDEEFRIMKHPDGMQRWVRVRSFLISDAHGDVVRVAGIIADITDLRKTQAQAQHQQQLLLQADKMASLGVLVSGIAHEINNPNNLIMFNADLLSRLFKHIVPIIEEHKSALVELWGAAAAYDNLHAEIPRLMKGISIGSQRIRDIAAELKTFARTDNGKLDQEIRINDVVKSALSIVNHLIVRSTDHFSEQYDASVPVLKGNIQQIEQVIINLLTNACQALSDPAQAIRIRTATDVLTQRVSVVVSDEGVGIPQEHLNRLFDPFFSTKRDQGGTGLGLSVSYNIVKAHGGTIEIDSVEGSGTTATLSLCIMAEENK